VLAALLCSLTLAGAACSTGGDDTGGVVSDRELSMMALDALDFGGEFRDFTPGDDNGFETLEVRAADQIDPQRETALLQDSGWEATYTEEYQAPDDQLSDSTYWLVATTVDRFETVEGAQEYFDESVRIIEEEEDVGKVTDGLVFERARLFDAEIGDQATGFTFHIVSETDPQSGYWATALAFRRGRLIASVGMYSFEEQAAGDSVRQLGQQLNERIGEVLASN
jgi:hypothetical protein